MKIVVTGGLGYIGSFLLRSLPLEFPAAKIVVLDDLSTGSKNALAGVYKVRFIRSDIRTYDFEKLKLRRGDTVVHLAGLSRPLESFGNEKDFYSVNCKGAIRIARACAASGAFFFFPSTTSVYHHTKNRWIKNCKSYLRPQTPYAASKLAAEQALSKIPSLRYTVIRFGTIYGVAPALSLHTAVNKFCWQAASGKPVSVWTTALEQYRPYLDLKDASRLVSFLIKQKEFSGKTFNAVTNHATPRQVLREIKRCRSGFQVQMVPVKAMNRLSYKVSRKPIEKMGFKFQGSLRSSVREIINACD